MKIIKRNNNIKIAHLENKILFKDYIDIKKYLENKYSPYMCESDDYGFFDYSKSVFEKYYLKKTDYREFIYALGKINIQNGEKEIDKFILDKQEYIFSIIKKDDFYYLLLKQNNKAISYISSSKKYQSIKKSGINKEAKDIIAIFYNVILYIPVIDLDNLLLS